MSFFAYLRSMKHIDIHPDIVNVEHSAFLNEDELGDIRYANDDVIIIDNIQRVGKDWPAVRLNMLFVAYCREGRAQMNINGKSHMAYKGNLIICNGMQVLSNTMFSYDFAVDVLCISNRRVDEIIHTDNKAMDTFLYVNDNPILQLSEEEYAVYATYKEIFERKLHMRRHEYFNRSFDAMLTAAIYDFLAIIQRQRQDRGLGLPDNVESSDHAKAMVRKFLLLLVEDDSRHHSVKYFSDQLCITPKYLAAICKQQTGKTPSRWIKEQLIEKIRSMLVNTTLSSKEIAQRLDFPNPSFFGRFVRQHLGCTPIEFRKRHK